MFTTIHVACIGRPGCMPGRRWARVVGHRLHATDLLGSMGRVASSVDNALIKLFWFTMQPEPLDRQHWNLRVELARAIFECVEGWYLQAGEV